LSSLFPCNKCCNKGCNKGCGKGNCGGCAAPKACCGAGSATEAGASDAVPMPPTPDPSARIESPRRVVRAASVSLSR
jgi:hypothetical protein